MKHQHSNISAQCHAMWGACQGYMGHYGKHCRAWCWAIIILLVVLTAWGISMFVHSAPNHVVAACMAAITVFLLLMVVMISFQKKMMRRMLELKVAKFVPDVFVTHDDKTKSLIVNVTASAGGSCVLQQVWECESVSSEHAKKKELIKIKLPQPIKMGTEISFKLPMPTKVKNGMDDKGCCAKIALKFYVPMLSRELVVKICPDSLCVCHHLMPCCDKHCHHSCK